MSVKTNSISIKSADAAASRPTGLPLRRELTGVYASSLIVALSMAFASLAGLLYQTAIYPTNDLLLSFVPSDAFNLAVGLPVLLGSMWLARRGALAGLLSLPGALFYVLYMYVPYLVAVPFNLLSVLYLSLIALSAYTLIRLVASLDDEWIGQRLVAFIPARASAGILLGLAILIIVRQIAMIVSTFSSHTPVELVEIASWIADFTVAVPALLLVGIQLWRRKALGYAAGAGLLLGYGLLALSVVPFFVQPALYGTAQLDIGGLAAILVMATLCFIPFTFFVRGAASSRSSLSDLNATRVIATTIGVFFGLFSGVNHGLFEFLQGDKPTNSLVINAIGEAQRFWVEGTEPAFTLIPNFMITGIVSMIVGLAIVIWSIWFLPGKYGRIVFLGLFVLSFLVGGGIGQAFFFIPAWAFATRMGKPLTWCRKVIPRNTWLFLSRLWIATLVLATIVMLIGLEMAIFGYFPGITDPETLQNTNMIFVFGSAILFVISFIAGFGHELRRMDKKSKVVL